MYIVNSSICHLTANILHIFYTFRIRVDRGVQWKKNPKPPLQNFLKFRWPWPPRLRDSHQSLILKPYQKQNYADTLRPLQVTKKSVPLKPVSYLHGEPRVIWEEEEVEQMIHNENLQYAVIGKFSYGWPDI